MRFIPQFILICLCSIQLLRCDAFGDVRVLHHHHHPRPVSRSRGSTSRLYEDRGGDDNRDNEGVPDSIPLVKIDDGGSDLNDRFKYKVHALMGSFDPVGGAPDDENQNGNILNAMLTFPTQYTFNVVGKTPERSEESVERFIGDVKRIVSEGSGDPVDEMMCVSKARGKNFTKVSITAMVESSAIINDIYDSLSEISVMRF